MLPTTVDGRGAVAASLESAWGFDAYARIMNAVRKTDVTADRDFQRLYNRFYRIRRNPEWQGRYYALMERSKVALPTFGDALAELYDATGNVEASFTSKMLATLDPSLPIWDRLVLERLGLRPKGTSPQRRIEDAVGIYRQICEWYAAYLPTEDAGRNITLLDELLPGYTWLTDVKKIDFLLWSSR